MPFDDELNRALSKILFESELDYQNDWERFRQERELLRQQVARDQALAAQNEAQKALQNKISRSGGFLQYAKGHDADWRPPTTSAIISDVETGNGILLPSLKARGKDLYCFIPWVFVQYEPRHGANDLNIEGIYPFVQFEDDKWPTQDDFNWKESDLYSTGTLGRYAMVDDKQTFALYNSDKNHYHMLRGADKHFVDSVVESAVEGWIDEQEGTVSKSDYDEPEDDPRNERGR